MKETSSFISKYKPFWLPLLFCFLFSCSGKSNHKDTSVEFDQYYLQGQVLYTNNCSNCHQAEGTGLGLLYPPLNKSDFMDKRFEDVLCLMRHGTKGQLVVNGKTYNKEMPGVSTLTDIEIAEIATYIYNTWGHDKGLIKVNDATKILRSCKARSQ